MRPNSLSRDLITAFGHAATDGNFLSFRVPHAAAIERARAAVDVYADHRGDRMRFGFGLEITIEDVDAASEWAKSWQICRPHKHSRSPARSERKASIW
jgi:hypothetical protein